MDVSDKLDKETEQKSTSEVSDLPSEGMLEQITRDEVNSKKFRQISKAEFKHNINDYRFQQESMRGSVQQAYIAKMNELTSQIKKYERMMRDVQVLGQYEKIVYWEKPRTKQFGYIVDQDSQIGFGVEDAKVGLKRGMKKIEEVDFVMNCIRQRDMYYDLIERLNHSFSSQMQQSYGMDEQFNHLERQIELDFSQSKLKIECYQTEDGYISYALQHKNPLKRLILSLADRIRKEKPNSTSNTV
ncbi:hypothetical protein JXM83_05055 [Candidatus Woesearchaeota archaeon]|nr:hypothetical protein [Candidatus Woesearchaeota archaeon]